MANEGLVLRAIQGLTGQLQDETAARRSHNTNIGNLQLQGRQVDLGNRELGAKLAADEAMRKREEYLNEPVTFRQAVTQSKFPDGLKQKLITMAPPKVLDGMVFKRKNWVTEGRKVLLDMMKAGDLKLEKNRQYELDKRRTDAYTKYLGRGGGRGSQNQYKTSQKMDDLSRDYKTAMDSLKGEFGDVEDKAMARKISQAYRKDKRLIRRGLEPHFLDDVMGMEGRREEEGLPPLPPGAVLKN